MSDLIKREDAINAVEMFFKDAYDIEDSDVHCTDMVYEIDHIPTASRWHRVEEPPKEDGKYVAINTKTNWWYEASYENGVWKAVDLFCQRWVVIHPTHWMPIEPPKEE